MGTIRLFYLFLANYEDKQISLKTVHMESYLHGEPIYFCREVSTETQQSLSCEC